MLGYLCRNIYMLISLFALNKSLGNVLPSRSSRRSAALLYDQYQSRSTTIVLLVSSFSLSRCRREDGCGLGRSEHRSADRRTTEVALDHISVAGVIRVSV